MELQYKGLQGLFPFRGVFAARMMHEVTCGLFNAFIINMLNLDIRKDITIFDERIVIKDNGVRGAREAWNAGGSVAGRAAGVRVHYYDVIKGEYLLGDGFTCAYSEHGDSQVRQALYGACGVSGQECRTVQRRQPCGHGRKHIEPWPGI